MKVLNQSAQDILQSFRDAYSEQIGRQMNLASEEHILSSIYSYVLSTFTGVLNKSYDNRFLSTATGEALDHIAEQYGLSRRGETVKGYGAYFDLYGNYHLKAQYHVQGVKKPARSIIFYINGVKYYNLNEINLGAYKRISRFVTDEKDVTPMTRDELIRYSIDHKDDDYKTWAFSEPFTAEQCSSGLQNIQPIIYSNDAAFRKYIDENKYLYSPGIARCFESLLPLTLPAIVNNGRCVRQNEEFAPNHPVFEPGFIDIYMQPAKGFTAAREEPEKTEQLTGFRQIYEDQCDKFGAITLGQQLRLHWAEAKPAAIPAITFNMYVPKTFLPPQTTWGTALWHNKAGYTMAYLSKHSWGVGRQFDFNEFLGYFERPLHDFTTFDEIHEIRPATDPDLYARSEYLTCQVYDTNYNPSAQAPVYPDEYLDFTTSFESPNWTFNMIYV